MIVTYPNSQTEITDFINKIISLCTAAESDADRFSASRRHSKIKRFPFGANFIIGSLANENHKQIYVPICITIIGIQWTRETYAHTLCPIFWCFRQTFGSDTLIRSQWPFVLRFSARDKSNKCKVEMEHDVMMYGEGQARKRHTHFSY